MAIALRRPSTIYHRGEQSCTQYLNQPPVTVPTTYRQHESTQATGWRGGDRTRSIRIRPAEMASPYRPNTPFSFAVARYPAI